MGAGPATLGLRPLSVSQGGHPALLWGMCPWILWRALLGVPPSWGPGLQSQPLFSFWEAVLCLETLQSLGAGTRLGGCPKVLSGAGRCPW